MGSNCPFRQTALQIDTNLDGNHGMPHPVRLSAEQEREFSVDGPRLQLLDRAVIEAKHNILLLCAQYNSSPSVVSRMSDLRSANLEFSRPSDSASSVPGHVVYGKTASSRLERSRLFPYAATASFPPGSSRCELPLRFPAGCAASASFDASNQISPQLFDSSSGYIRSTHPAS